MENSPDLGKGIFSKLKNSLVLRLGQIFLTNNSIPKVQPSYKALVLGLGWANSYLFLRMVPSSYLLSVFEFFEFWCSQNVLIKFPKHSHQVPLTSQWVFKVPKMFSIPTIRNNIENNYPTLVSTHASPIGAFIQRREHQHICVNSILLLQLKIPLYIEA